MAHNARQSIGSHFGGNDEEKDAIETINILILGRTWVQQLEYSNVESLKLMLKQFKSPDDKQIDVYFYDEQEQLRIQSIDITLQELTFSIHDVIGKFEELNDKFDIKFDVILYDYSVIKFDTLSNIIARLKLLKIGGIHYIRELNEKRIYDKTKCLVNNKNMANVVKRKRGTHIKIRGLSKKPFTINVDINMTVCELRNLLSHLHLNKPDIEYFEYHYKFRWEDWETLTDVELNNRFYENINIMFAGKFLIYDKKLSDYYIRNNAVLNLDVSSMGGNSIYKSDIQNYITNGKVKYVEQNKVKEYNVEDNNEQYQFIENNEQELYPLEHPAYQRITDKIKFIKIIRIA